ncbi:MAG: hypothetical protein ACR2G5_11670, partial [Pyrinomonadaceae bacterium]
FALNRLHSRGESQLSGARGNRETLPAAANAFLLNGGENARSAEQHAYLRSIANEGDIILPLEVCVIRRGETFKQWTKRAKYCSIEAARQATGGTLKSAAEQLGLTQPSLKGYLRRAKGVQNDALFEWKRESD